MSCVLRVSGAEFDVDEFLAGSPLKALVTVHRGDERVQANRPTFRYESSGMNVSISTREFSDLSGQVDDAVRFLTDNVRELRRLKEFPGVQTMHLDFPIQDRGVFQKDAFPPQLLA